MKKTRRLLTIVLSFTLIFQTTISNVFATEEPSFFEKMKNTVSDTVADLTHIDVKGWYEDIDFSMFQDGWNKAKKYATGTFVGKSKKEYMKYMRDVSNAIDSFKTTMNDSLRSNRGIKQEKGFAAEIWHTETFNIDSIAKGSDYKASRPASNQLGSADIETNYGELASLKYYKNGTESAKAQATDILDEYRKYKAKSDNPLELEEYLNKKGYSKEEYDALFESLYKGQKRIIPSDQIDEATEFLKGKKGSTARGKAYEETLSNLRDRLEAPDGTASKPVSNEEMEAITELCKDGKFKPEQFGVSVTQVVTPKYIVKQAIGAGVSGATLEGVLTVGPELFSIILNAAKNGDVDMDALKETGIDGFISAGNGFLEGSVSAALITATSTGKLGSAFKNTSPDTIGTISVMTIDGIRYGYSLAKGDITTEDYGNLMAEEAFTAAMSQGSGVALKALLPMIPGSYMIGCLIGGMLASAGFEMTQAVIVEVKDGNGFEAIVPKGVTDTISVASEKISKLDLKNKITKAKDIAVTTSKTGLIKIQSIAS